VGDEIQTYRFIDTNELEPVVKTIIKTEKIVCP
jgi:hypothetical protein